ncbi:MULTISPECIES: chromate transporter [Paenibacillus]|uniref:Chromate transporter n=1 Tax=Paenibacillus vini TaxID=1476024 RepID=A0ABQ4MB45_9BACL|nr:MULTISPECIES: chromate transporter [Paenibacillus]MBQ4898679.1 chromate transporter [Paenibacillus sp. Marseille-P2973]MDN4069387.1 chromate transporter [Paenibacillus vini]GIP53197.1 chromate transporter [Paenibacillus vini]
MLWQLFLVFIKVGLISFGGGYAVMTLIQREVAGKGWVEAGEFQEIVSLAGMAPGSIATNTATLIGYSQSGFLGAVAATVGIILPSLIIVIILTASFIRLQNNDLVKSSFYGLRPVVTGLIIYAAIHFGLSGRSESLLSWSMAGTLLICAGCLTLVTKYKVHPFGVILLAAVAGIVIF